MFRSCFVGIALIAMLGVGCNRDQSRAANEPGTPATPEAGAMPGTSEMLTSEQREFVQTAAEGGQHEVDMAKMAQDKAQSNDVKDFARQLEQDHAEANDDLRGVARKANLDLPSTPAAERASMDNELNAKTGRDFDRAYIDQMVEHHQKDIAEFERMQISATGDLKEFIDKTLPVLREHLSKAEALQRTVTSR